MIICPSFVREHRRHGAVAGGTERGWRVGLAATRDWYRPIRVRVDPEAEHQPAGGYTDAYELICCACGDHPDLDYRDISPEHQRIRGPYPVAAGVGAYEKHLELRHRRQPTRRAGRPVHDSSG